MHGLWFRPETRTMTIRVGLQVTREEPFVWMPVQTLQNDILLEYESGRNTAMTFKVEDVEFKAHLFVLFIRCPQLAAFATENEDNVTIPILNSHPVVFDMMLHLVGKSFFGVDKIGQQ